MRPVFTPDAPAPGGHYSQAVIHGDTVYVAGQLPFAPGTKPGDQDPGDAYTQTRQAMANLGAILDAAGSGLDHALQVVLYVSDIDLWSEVNRAYVDIMGDHKPARAVVPVGPLHYGYVVEIQAVAALR